MKESDITTEEAGKLAPEVLFKRLGSGAKGISSREAAGRLEKYGYNEIAENKVSPYFKFLGYFWGPIPWMIEVAAVLSVIIGHWGDFWIIFIMLILNAVVGFWQEHKADNAIELLKQKLALKSKVLRDGKWQVLPAKELVPGDMVRVRLGDIIPADLKLIEGEYLLSDESALTGESMPVEKHVSDVSYAGSIVRQGEMDALAVATGMNTFFGKTARLVEKARTVSHFQKAVIKIGDYLIAVAMVLVTLILVVSVFRHESFAETLQFALVLTVAAIPVALPAVLSVTMAVGAIALAKKEAIVSRLVSIEEMAGMDILCSDKTGTITKNEISVAGLHPMDGFTEKDLSLLSVLSSREENGDPIDNAVVARARSTPGLMEEVAVYRAVGFRPFDPVAKRAEATIEGPGVKRFKVTKGAPQVILALTGRSEGGEEVSKQVDSLAAKGYRALGVARSDEEGKWRLVGLLALHDPPREDSAETIKTAQSMGVDVKMVTGDHTAIAMEISRQVNLGTNILSVDSFLDKPDREAGRAVEEADGFAKVFPEHKFHIVELLQIRGHIVGMTGDGVNDAPALKKADAGIAVAGATDAARSAADIVLTRPGLSVIIDAIKESRKIFQRMNSYAIYRIAETIRVLLFMTLSILVFKFYPVTAVMIVLLALLNDLPIMTIALDNVKYSDRPERWTMPVVFGVAASLGLMGVVASFGIFYIGMEYFHLSKEMLQSFIYLKLSVAGHMTLFVARTRGTFWSTRPSLPLLLAVLATQITATLIVVYGIVLPPIGWRLSLFVWGYSLSWFIFNDIVKRAAYRLFERGVLGREHLERTGRALGAPPPRVD